MAAACLHLLEHYDGDEHVNVGTGTDVSIAELAETVAKVVGYDGPIEWDTSKPDGTPRKLLDVTKLTDLGWTASIPLDEGIASTYQWFLEQHGTSAARRGFPEPLGGQAAGNHSTSFVTADNADPEWTRAERTAPRPGGRNSDQEPFQPVVRDRPEEPQPAR